MKKKLLTLSVIVMLNACCTKAFASSELLGTLLGGGAGAWAGSTIGKGDGRLVATGAGAILGAVVGNNIGTRLDERDEMIQGRVLNRVLSRDIYEPTSWNNPDTGNYGRIYVQPSSYQYQPCRDFTNTIFVDGRAETVRGRACPNSDGTWYVIR